MDTGYHACLTQAETTVRSMDHIPPLVMTATPAAEQIRAADVDCAISEEDGIVGIGGVRVKVKISNLMRFSSGGIVLSE